MRKINWLPLFTLAVALLAAAPALLMRYERGFYRSRFPEDFKTWTNNGSFSMIDSFTLSEDNYYYAARIRHAATHALPGDPYIRENRSLRVTLTDFVTFFSYGLVERLTGDPKSAWVLSQFLFTLMWVPLLYAVLRRLGAGGGQALFVAVGVTLFADMARILIVDRHFLGTLAAAFQYAFWFLGSYHYFLGPTRITGPLFTYPCLFLSGLAFVRAAERRDRASVALAGLAGGALAYVHSDVWLTFMGAAFLYAAFRSWESRRPELRLWAALALAGALSLPVVLTHRGLADAEFLGLLWKRYFDWRAVPLLAGSWLALRLGRDGMALWCASSLFALFLASNVQLVTGWSLTQGHWLYIGNVFLALTVGRWLGGRKPEDGPHWLWLAGGLCLLALPRVVSYSALHYKVYGLPAAQEEAFDWLEKNTPKDAVVAALSPQTLLKIPVHTHDKTISSFLFPVMSDIPREENAGRIAFALSLYGAKLDDYVREASDASGDYTRRLWTGAVDQASLERSNAFVLHFCHLSRAKILALLERAASGPIAAYPADYLWVGPFERKLLPRSGLPDAARLEKVFENAETTIYRRVSPTGSAPSLSATR